MLCEYASAAPTMVLSVGLLVVLRWIGSALYPNPEELLPPTPVRPCDQVSENIRLFPASLIDLQIHHIHGVTSKTVK
jgi:hypothetical protein